MCTSSNRYILSSFIYNPKVHQRIARLLKYGSQVCSFIHKQAARIILHQTLELSLEVKLKVIRA